MMSVRLATVADAELIAEQRRKMFADSGQAEGAAMDAMAANFVEWVRPRLAEGSYAGWLMEEGGEVAAGAGLWMMEFPPHWMDERAGRAYLLNFYTEPAYRGRGLAVEMLRLAVDEARRRGARVVALHASKFGRPIYERQGFAASNEMLLRV